MSEDLRVVETKIYIDGVYMENSIQESRYAYKLRRCELYRTHTLQKMHREHKNDGSRLKNGNEQTKTLDNKTGTEDTKNKETINEGSK